jgi:hypothetical protein
MTLQFLRLVAWMFFVIEWQIMQKKLQRLRILTISYCNIWLTSNVIYGDIISSSPHVKEPSVTAHYEHYAHNVWSIRDQLHWQNYPSLPITFPCFESRGFKIFKCSRPEYSWKIARWTLNINQSINHLSRFSWKLI